MIVIKLNSRFVFLCGLNMLREKNAMFGYKMFDFPHRIKKSKQSSQVATRSHRFDQTIGYV